MSALLKQALYPDMGLAVLDLLKTLSPLPDRGIVAGQAVTSALLHLYGDGRRHGPFNDIDIFLPGASWHRPLAMSFDIRSLMVTSMHRQQYMTKDGGYEHIEMLSVVSRAPYRITRVRREGLLNFIDINPVKIRDALLAEHVATSPAEIVAGFDINCCEAAVDLQTKQLLWTRHFDFFCKTAQLQVTNIHGEPHTMIRLFKKMKEMPWAYCDVPAAAEALQFSLEYKFLLHKGNADRLPKIGPVYIERLRRYAGDMMPYFQTVAQTKINHSNSTALLIRPTVALEGISEATFGSLKQLAIRSLGEEQHSVLNNITARALHLSYGSRLKSGKSQERNRLEISKATSSSSGSFLKGSLFTQGNSYLKGQVLVTTACQVNEFLKQHFELAPLFSVLPFDEQLAAMKNLKALDKETDGMAIGLVESTSTMTPALLASPMELRQRVVALVEHYKKPFDIQPLHIGPLPNHLRHLRVRELLCLADLMTEGKEMRHCVAGYAGEVSGGDSRIFSFIGPQGKRSDRSTMELEANDTFGETIWIVSQHRGFANDTIPKDHKEAGHLVAQMANDHVVSKLGLEKHWLQNPIDLGTEKTLEEFANILNAWIEPVSTTEDVYMLSLTDYRSKMFEIEEQEMGPEQSWNMLLKRSLLRTVKVVIETKRSRERKPGRKGNEYARASHRHIRFGLLDQDGKITLLESNAVITNDVARLNKVCPHFGPCIKKVTTLLRRPIPRHLLQSSVRPDGPLATRLLELCA